MAPLEYGHNDNGVYGAYGATATTVNIGWGQISSTEGTVRWTSGYDYSVSEPTPTKAELARSAMRRFLGSVRPADLFRPRPALRAPEPVLHQMVHRRRCQSLGRPRPPRFSRA